MKDQCDYRRVLVPIPEYLLERNAESTERVLRDDGTPCFLLDACMVSAVQALWTAGVVTVGCCCSHNHETAFAVISLDVEHVRDD